MKSIIIFIFSIFYVNISICKTTPKVTLAELGKISPETINRIENKLSKKKELDKIQKDQLQRDVKSYEDLSRRTSKRGQLPHSRMIGMPSGSYDSSVGRHKEYLKNFRSY